MPQLVSVYKAGLQVSEAGMPRREPGGVPGRRLFLKRISGADYGSNPSFQWLLQTATFSASQRPIKKTDR